MRSLIPMRILFWNTGFAHGVGGAEKQVLDLLNLWDSQGLPVFLVTNRPERPGAVPTFLSRLRPGVTVHQDWFPYPFGAGKHLWDYGLRPLRYLGASARLIGFFNRVRPQVVHLHYVNFDVFLLALYRCLFHYRLVITFTGGDVALAERSKMCALRMALALRLADTATGVSQNLCDRLERRFQRSVQCVHNGVDLHELQTESEEPVPGIEDDQFVFVGRLAAVKRVDFLIRAFRRCVNEGCGKKLYILGPGEEAQRLQALIHELNLEGVVLLLGGQSHAHALAVTRRSRCLLLVSSSEGFPIVLLEAMALGVPVISSDVGGVSELVTDGVNGWLFPVDDVSQLCEQIMRLAGDQTEARRLGTAAAQTVADRLSLETMALKYLSLYGTPPGAAAGEPYHG